LNVLFVCSRNQWRSPTAEHIFKGLPGISVKSAGTEKAARITVNQKMLQWADIVFVMEKKHKTRMEERFPSLPMKIVILDIPDDYQFMDPELVGMLKESVNPYLKND
jgi:protein-tyrosine phosphatase